jgi:hypothetical protein
MKFLDTSPLVKGDSCGYDCLSCHPFPTWRVPSPEQAICMTGLDIRQRPDSLIDFTGLHSLSCLTIGCCILVY